MRQVDFDIPINDSQEVRARIHAGNVLVDIPTVTDAKPPMVNPATDDVAVDVSMGKRGAGMRTVVIECKEFAINVKDTDCLIVDNEHP